MQLYYRWVKFQWVTYLDPADTGDDAGECMASCKACWCVGPPCVCSEEDFWRENKSGAWNGLKSDLWDPRGTWSHIVHSDCNKHNFHSDRASGRAESSSNAAQDKNTSLLSQSGRLNCGLSFWACWNFEDLYLMSDGWKKKCKSNLPLKIWFPVRVPSQRQERWDVNKPIPKYAFKSNTIQFDPEQRCVPY